jgi:glycerophosphoryl diester phosphodiesterase
MKHLILSAVMTGLLAVSSPAQETNRTFIKSDWNVVEHVPAEKFLIQSHRGAGVLAEENTIEAFKLGWSLGTVPESDLRTTKDGVIVAFHDDNFKRVVKGASEELQKKGVADLTFAELSKLDVGSWKGEQFLGRHVSKISEAFDLMKGHPERQLYLDIKNISLPQLAKEVQSRGIDKQVILASTKYEIIREWKALVPQSQTLLWLGGDEAKLNGRLDEVRKSNFADITQLQIHIRLNKDKRSSEPFTPSSAFMVKVGKEIRSHHILFQSLPWDVADPNIYSALLDLGVASFATDHPDVTVQAVKDYYAKHKQAVLP